MENYSQEEIQDALKLIVSTIHNCEKMQHKFTEGKPQHTLLRNRIKALQISKCLIEGSSKADFTADDLKSALPPVLSIISKTKKAQSKYDELDSRNNRFIPIINAMEISRCFIEKEIYSRNQEGQP